MQIHQSLTELSSNGKVSYAVTFGKFDGLHLGHQALLKKLRTAADNYHSQTLIISFLYAIDGGEHSLQNDWDVSSPYICSKFERERMFAAWGIEHLLYLRFDEIQGFSYETFLNMLLEAISITVFVGSDKFSIGAKKQGKPEQICDFLQKKATQNQNQPRQPKQPKIATQFSPSMTFSECYPNLYQMTQISYDSPSLIEKYKEEYGEKPLSTTFIKKTIETGGGVFLSSQLLWLPFALTGNVIVGQGKGRELGFPTANFFNNEPKIKLPQATYLTWVEFQGTICPALTFIGFPSMRENTQSSDISSKTEPVVESFILDSSFSMYNNKVKVYFLSFLRENIEFASYQDLKNRIQKDVEQARAFFNHPSYQKFFKVIQERIHRTNIQA